MPLNKIELSEISLRNDGLRAVKLYFNETEWRTLTITELKTILRLWIKGEEEKYPQSPKCKGRYMLLHEIMKVFNEGET